MIGQVSFRQVAPWVAAAVLLLVLGSAAAQEIQVLLRSKQRQTLPEEIERLARDFRIQVYNSFRANRPEYDRRRQAWEDVQAKWREAGAKDEDVARLAEWLREATDSSVGTGVSALPSTPAFGSPPVTASGPEVQPLAPQPAAPPLADAPPQVPPATEPTAPQRTPLEPAPLPPPDRVAEKPALPDAPPVTDFPPARPVPAPSAPIAPPRPIEPLPLPPRETAQVNVEELAVRIAGYNLAMRSLDAQLLTRSNHSIADLAGMVHRLDDLRTAHEDVKLYWNLLDADQRQGLSEMFPARELITSLADRIGRTRGKLVVDGGAAEAEQRALLDDLSRKLAELAVEFEQSSSVGY